MVMLGGRDDVEEQRAGDMAGGGCCKRITNVGKRVKKVDGGRMPVPWLG